MATIVADRNMALNGSWRIVVILALITSFGMILGGWKAQSLVDNRHDPYYFERMGRSVARGEGFSEYGLLLRRRAPLYPLMIGGVYHLIGERPFAIQLIQSLLFMGTCLLVLDIGSRLYNPRTGLIAAILCTVHPVLLRYVPDFHLETLLTFLFTLTLWFSVRFYKRPTIAHGLAMGTACGLASLTKAVVVLYPLLFVAVWILQHLIARKSGLTRTLPPLAAVSIFVAMGAVILPWTIRNYRVTRGHFVLITTGLSDAFIRGYIFSKPEYALLRLPPYTFAEQESNRTLKAICAKAGAVWQANDVETDKILNREAIQWLKTDPMAFVRKFIIGLFTFWYQMTSLANSVITGLPALIGIVLGFFGWLRSRREGQPSWLLILPILYLNISLAALLALGRYSAPIIPVLMVLAAFGIDTLLTRREQTNVLSQAA
jgi:4-amino-4-deoxy-L-arabinose transferase-like glycosyltransferase